MYQRLRPDISVGHTVSDLLWFENDLVIIIREQDQLLLTLTFQLIT